MGRHNGFCGCPVERETGSSESAREGFAVELRQVLLELAHPAGETLPRLPRQLLPQPDELARQVITGHDVPRFRRPARLTRMTYAAQWFYKEKGFARWTESSGVSVTRGRG
nr:hypothetical protein GCM10017745_41010 [Saccharothrix mutabilis subsp. capreolus]